MRCPDCAATGDKWDRNTEDWSNPREECPHCDGYGEVGDPPEKTNPHVIELRKLEQRMRDAAPGR